MLRLVVILYIFASSSCDAILEGTSILSHFQYQQTSKAHLQQATQLPFIATKSIFHLDTNLFSENEDELINYESMMEYEAKARLLDSSDVSLPFVLCGSQRTAKFARSEISQYYSGRLSVVYVSRAADVACWRASLQSHEAEQLASSTAFFHVSQIPAVTKFSPELLFLTSNNQVAPAYQAMKTGVRVTLDIEQDNGHIIKRWRDERFGMLTYDRKEYLYPMSDQASVDSWKNVRNVIKNGVCHDLLKPFMKHSDSSNSDILHVSFEKLNMAENEEVEDCVVAVLAYFATQNEVVNIEVIPTFILHSLVPDSKKPTREFSINDIDDGGDVGTNAKPMNTISTTALQSGDENEPNPFWDLGINGTGQFVEVSDTGFDDASCFFRQENSAAYLTGSLNTDYQVTRSGYSSPITDKTRRKVVQYLMRDTSNSDYAQDYASGHGSHCAGTVAGYIPNDGSAQDPDDDYYNNCVDYIAYCDTWFAPGGDYAGTCDTTCGIAPTDAYSGMAPGAKLMVYDFGDSAGALSVPTDMENEVYKPAYDQGARITSNSWGSGAPYNYYDTQAINIDQYVYDKDDVLVLFAAGNDGGGSTDDVYEDGDATIGGPAVCKNVLTVGAAETTYTPDTVASFSSRGPTPDMRLKPEVCGPGNPVTSAKASGSAGLASCAATTKSGTSMATPAVAGTAALIREILIEGKHEYFSSTGYASSSYSESAPSAALLKALLIGSTVPLTYGYDTSGSTVTLSNFYSASSAVADSTAYALGTTGVDFTQGFGHVRLSNIFSVDGSFDTFCYEDSLAEYSTWTSEFEVSSTASEVAITLVWTDPPGSQYCGYTSSVTCLIHDLDLKVYNDGTRLYSNFGAGDGDYSGQEDTLNNAEKVTIATSDLTVGTTITVTVETNGLSYADTQKFAVVVAGNIGATGTSPVPVPTMKPTQPIPTPTSYPVSIPIPSPTRTPIHVPTKLPNPNPTFEPTPQPNQFPNPTPHPTSLRPSLFPTESPVRGPSFNPTGVPTKLPSKMPTSVPTMFPTSLDTVTIITSFDLTSSAVPTSSDEISLKSTLANELDVSETSIKDFSLTYTTSRRVRRHLLTTYTWTAAFEVSVSLASTSSTTSDELATSVSSTITSSSFTSSVATNTGATVDTTSVSTVVVTRSPSLYPTTAPKKKNKKTKSAFESSTGLNAASLGGMAVGALLLIIGCGCFIKYTFCQKHYAQFLDEGHGTHEMGTSHVKKGNYLFSSSAPPPPPATNVWVSETTSPMTMNKNPSFTIHDILENQPAQKQRATNL